MWGWKGEESLSMVVNIYIYIDMGERYDLKERYSPTCSMSVDFVESSVVLEKKSKQECFIVEQLTCEYCWVSRNTQ